jgi:hypothetical protein
MKSWLEETATTLHSLKKEMLRHKSNILRAAELWAL